MVNGDSVPFRDSNRGGSGTQLVYQAVEMAAAVHEDIPLHSWVLLVLYPTKTRGSSIQGKTGMV